MADVPTRSRTGNEVCSLVIGRQRQDVQETPVEAVIVTASFKANSATIKVKSTITAKPKNPPSADARDRAHLAMKTAKSTMIATGQFRSSYY
jgi:hypothetical protein